jgi:hypothetical protein
MFDRCSNRLEISEHEAASLLTSIFREALLRERLGLVRLCLQD